MYWYIFSIVIKVSEQYIDKIIYQYFIMSFVILMLLGLGSLKKFIKIQVFNVFFIFQNFKFYKCYLCEYSCKLKGNLNKYLVNKYGFEVMIEVKQRKIVLETG